MPRGKKRRWLHCSRVSENVPDDQQLAPDAEPWEDDIETTTTSEKILDLEQPTEHVLVEPLSNVNKELEVCCSSVIESHCSSEVLPTFLHQLPEDDCCQWPKITHDDSDDIGSECSYFYDCISDFDDEDNATTDEPPPNDDPLYAGCSVSFSECMVAILTFMMSHQLSKHCLADFLSLLKLLLPSGNALVESCYSFFSHFVDGSCEFIRHYYCRQCSQEMESRDSVCVRCGPGKGTDYFIQLSISKQLQKLFHLPEFYDNLKHPQTRVKKNVNAYEDLYDGAVYKEATRDYFHTGNWLSFMWNTDGFSIFKSSLFQVWPLYFAVNELPPHMRYQKQYMVLAGLWFGVGKFDPNIFLKPIYEELTKLKSGFDFILPNNQQPVKYKVCVLCGTCDSPAKSQFFCHVNFNGLYGCPKCLCRGEKSERTDNVFVYPFEEELPLRTDQSNAQHLADVRRTGSRQYGIKGPSFLSKMLLLSSLRSTAIDTMHALFLGVQKSLINLWFSDTYKNDGFSLFKCKQLVNDYLVSVKPPHFIQRSPQSLDKIAFWKASEFQSFFFFYSLPILQKIMHQICFSHFKLLYVGICLLYKDSITEADITLSELLLTRFVKQYEDLYGLRHMTFNLHLLRHLPNAVRDLGPLWATSCFTFEDLNGALKHLVHGTQFVGHQVQSNFDLSTRLPFLITEISNKPLMELCLKMASPFARYKVSFVVKKNTFVIGPMYKEILNLHPLVVQSIQLIIGNILFFKRLKMFSNLYEVKKDRCHKKNSSFVSYTCNGSISFGQLLSLIKVSQCVCSDVCLCPGEYYAIIHRFNTDVPFHVPMPYMEITNIFLCQESGISDTIPMFDLKCVCAGVEIENQLYIINQVTKYLVQ